MANKVAKHKILGVKQELLKNKTYKEAMMNNGYSEKTANNGADTKVIQEAQDEIIRDLKKQDVTTESVRLNLQENRELAKKKGDISAMNRADELLGKMITAFTDKLEHKDTSLTPQMEQEIHKYIQGNRLGVIGHRDCS